MLQYQNLVPTMITFTHIEKIKLLEDLSHSFGLKNDY